jgi:hypothetical protein
MPVVVDFDTEVKVGGLILPLTLAVIDKLGYELILGMDFLREARAVIDTSAKTLTLFGGLSSVPMTQTGAHPVVRAATAVEIPPMSEAVFPVKTSSQIAVGNYVIEDAMMLPCRTLVLARSLVNPKVGAFACRVLNPTENAVKLRAGTPVGILAAVSIDQICPEEPPPPLKGDRPSVAQMLKALEQKGISLADCALAGQERDELIEFLYRNMDIMATSLAELPGTDVLRHRIDTGTSAPVRKRTYRHSPADKAEISRQVQEMLDADIIEPSDSPWSSPVLLVTKKDLSKRFVVDFRGLNSVTSMTSYPLPTAGRRDRCSG